MKDLKNMYINLVGEYIEKVYFEQARQIGKERICYHPLSTYGLTSLSWIYEEMLTIALDKR